MQAILDNTGWLDDNADQKCKNVCPLSLFTVTSLYILPPLDIVCEVKSKENTMQYSLKQLQFFI